jgi:hypothetical protein
MFCVEKISRKEGPPVSLKEMGKWWGKKNLLEDGKAGGG